MTTQEIQEAIERIRSYGITLNENEPIKLSADGMCENPGPMAIGLFACQGSTCLFTQHMLAGHGTCNEAEYIAVKTGLLILQALYPTPGVPVIVSSDSQLVVNQVNNLWKSKGQMQNYCIFLKRLRTIYPYTLQKVPRSENQMADGLAQQYMLKHSGRCMTLEQGRFNVLKQVPATVKTLDTYVAVTSREFRDYLNRNNLHEEMRSLLLLASRGERELAIGMAHDIGAKAELILAAAPKTNDLVAQWLINTIGLMKKSVGLILDNLQNGGRYVDIQYVIEELTGAADGDSDIFNLQVDHIREYGAPAESGGPGEEVWD